MDFNKFLNLKKTQPPAPVNKIERTAEEQALDDEFWKNQQDIGILDWEECKKISNELFDKKGKKWFDKQSRTERDRLISEWDKQANEKVFEEHRADYLHKFSELKKQWAETLSQNHDKVLKEAESDPILKDTYEQVIQNIFRSGSSIQFEVSGAGNVSGMGIDTGGFCSYKFNPELKKMISVRQSELDPNIDEKHKSILPIHLSSETYTNEEMFQEKIKRFRLKMPEGYKEKYLYMVRQFIQGKKGNAYYSDTRPGHGYTIGIVMDPNVDPSIMRQEEIFSKLQDTDLRKILDMLANTFIPEYNQGIKELAKNYNNKL